MAAIRLGPTRKGFTKRVLYAAALQRASEERTNRPDFHLFDEPESALSRKRQLELLKLLRRMEDSQPCQMVIAAHSPILMAYPDADLLHLTAAGLSPIDMTDTEHFRLMQDFCADPEGFVAGAIEETESAEDD